MASQYAGWAITPDGYFAMGSGPLRAHARVEKELFAKLDYAESASHGVLVLETRTLPDEPSPPGSPSAPRIVAGRADAARRADGQHRPAACRWWRG